MFTRRSHTPLPDQPAPPQAHTPQPTGGPVAVVVVLATPAGQEARPAQTRQVWPAQTRQVWPAEPDTASAERPATPTTQHQPGVETETARDEQTATSPHSTPAGYPPDRRSALTSDAGPADADTRTLSATLYTPQSLSRRDRNTADRQARNLETQARKTRLAADRAARKTADEEGRTDKTITPGGQRRPQALRTYRRLRIQPHRATSDQIGGIYPFLAEAGLGSDGIRIGTDSYSGSAFVYDPFVLYQKDVLTNPNILVAGNLGTGKSTFAKSFTTRSIPFGRRIYVPGDPKGEWTIVARTVGGQAIELGRGMPTRLNPLDEGIRPQVWVNADGGEEPMTDHLWDNTVRSRRLDLLKAITQTALGRDLQSVELTALRAALDNATARTGGHPTLPHVTLDLHQPAGDVAGSTRRQLTEDGRPAAHALNRLVDGDLAGLFDGPSTTTFDPDLAMVSLDLSRISGSDQLIALVVTCASTWMESALQDPKSPQRYIVYDEAWRTLREPSLLARMQAQWKLARALGISNLMIIHALSDLDAVGEADSQSRNLALGLLRDCSTKVIYAQPADQIAHTATALGLNSTESRELLHLAKGEALWRVGADKTFIVTHRITSDEQHIFDTNSRMTTSISDTAEQPTVTARNPNGP